MLFKIWNDKFVKFKTQQKQTLTEIINFNLKRLKYSKNAQKSIKYQKFSKSCKILKLKMFAFMKLEKAVKNQN